MDEELLISLVQKYKELYDLGDTRYHDEQRRVNIWQEIAHIMNETPTKCKEKWKRIRDNYRRAKKLRQTKSGQAATNTKPIRFEKELNFLSPFINNDTQQNLTNLPPLSDDEQVISPLSTTESQVMSPLSTTESQVMSPLSTIESPSTSRSSRSPSRATKKSKTDRISQLPTPTQTLFQSYLEKKYQSVNQGRDTVVDFFTNLGQTVTTFPQDVQIRVKGAVFKIVNDAEADLVHRQGGRVEYPNIILNTSRECQNMRATNLEPVSTVILSAENQVSPLPLQTSGETPRLISSHASATTAPMKQVLSNSFPTQQVHEEQVYEIQEYDVQGSNYGSDNIMGQFLHFPKNK